MRRDMKQVWMGIAFSALSLIGPSLCAEEFSEEDRLFLWGDLISDAGEPAGELSTHPAPQPVRGHRMFDPQGLKNDNGLWIDGEVLFWQSNVGDLDYAVESKSTTGIDHGRVKHPEFDWDWGFRLGLGYKLPYDKWDIFVNYTYVHANAHGHAHEHDGAVYPIWATAFGFQGSSFYATEAKAHWHANLNMADLELGRNCFVSKWLSIRPFVGVRGLVIDQDYHLKYSGGTAFPGDTDKLHLDTDFWGVGIRMGLNTLWGLGAGFGIYGNGSASLLSGHFDVHENEWLSQADLRRLDIKRDVDNVVVTADLALGLQWDYLFSKDRYHFGVKFGWEFNIFFNQNQLFNFMSTSLPGSISFKDDDLSFQGLTLGFRFDF